MTAHQMIQPNIRPCLREDWPAFADCIYAMWRDIGASPEQIQPDWQQIVIRFLEDAERDGFGGHVAEADQRIIGTAGGQLMGGLSPQIVKPSYRLRGYVWGVYVAPAWRGQGIARKLTSAVVAHLQSLGCTQVLLHAATDGYPVYQKMGFTASHEMKLLLPTSGTDTKC